MTIVWCVNFDRPSNLCILVKTFFVHSQCMTCSFWSGLESMQSNQGLLCSWPLYGMWTLIGPQIRAVWSRHSLFMVIVWYVNFDWPSNLCSLIKAFFVHGHCMVCDWPSNLCSLIKAFFVHDHCMVCNFDRPLNLCSLIKAFFVHGLFCMICELDRFSNLCS